LGALSKVFEVDFTRLDERDFYQGDLSSDIEIEVTLGALGGELEQRFLDDLEFWNPAEARLVPETGDLRALPTGSVPVLRLAYRGRWDDIDERGDQTIYWPKRSDPSTDSLRRVRREDRQVLPFHRLPGGRPLNLAPRGLLRSALTETEAEALDGALQDMREGIDRLSNDLASTVPVIAALTATIDLLRPYLGTDAPVEEIIRFLPDEGSLSGLLRALAPALDLGDDIGFLPLARHGSTMHAQVAMAEAIATASHDQAVVIVDDFADLLDTASAQRLASLLRKSCGQVWLSTRRPDAARSFDSSELVRLVRQPSGERPSRTVYYGNVATTRAQRVAARELHRQILPAMTALGAIIVEGPHDAAAYAALAERQEEADGSAPPEAYGIRIIDGGAQGGIDNVAHLAATTRALGFRVVALVDYDHDEIVAASRLAALQAAANVVIRLPKGSAIEAAILDGLSDSEIVSSLSDLEPNYQLPLAAGWQSLADDDLRLAAMRALKSNNGLHAPFIHALGGSMPAMGARALQTALGCCRGINTSAFVQL
jgi:hypothetical protein